MRWCSDAPKNLITDISNPVQEEEAPPADPTKKVEEDIHLQFEKWVREERAADWGAKRGDRNISTDMIEDLVREFNTTKKLKDLLDEALAAPDPLAYMQSVLESTVGRPVALVAHEVLKFLKEAFAADLLAALSTREPHPLLGTAGAAWDYQPNEHNQQQLETELPKFFNQYTKEKEDGTKARRDKQNTPLFLLLSGPGTGKSRELTEIPGVCRRLFPDTKTPLGYRLSTAVTYHVSFENGTPYTPFLDTDPSTAIGARMAWQMLPDEARAGLNFPDYFKKHKDFRPGISEVLVRLAELKGCDLSDLTVFLLVDGVQKTMNEGDGSNKNSFFYQMFTTAAAQAITSKAFVISCVSATIVKPVEDALADSQQNRIHLSTSELEPPKGGDGRPLFPNHPMVNVLVQDMGGHGRALEALADALHEHDDMDMCDFSDVARSVKKTLQRTYAELKQVASEVVPILRVILTNRLLDVNKPVPGTELRVDKAAAYGLMRLMKVGEGVGRLTCPYVLLWLFADLCAAPVLQHWRFDDYSALMHHVDPSAPRGTDTWMHFKEFVDMHVQLRCSLFDQEWKKLMSEVYAGTRHNAKKKGGVSDQKKQYNTDVEVLCQSLERIQASHHYPSRSDQLNAIIVHEQGKVDVSSGRYLVRNAAGASAGDSWCRYRTKGDVVFSMSASHQHKNYGQKYIVSETELREEQKKAAEPGRDALILFTTGRCDADLTQLPQYCGVVSYNEGKGEWGEYFGPLAGRAFLCATEEFRPDVNRSPRSVLTAVKGLGGIRAQKIINNRPYNDMDECKKKCGLPCSVVSLLQCCAPPS